MKKIVVVLVSLVVAVLIGMGNAFAQDKTPEASIPNPPLSSNWILVGRGLHGTTTYVNIGKITHLPGGIVEVRFLLVPRGEFRGRVVNDLKESLLFKGKDPNNAKRLWYYIELDKFNCKSNQYAITEMVAYSFEKRILDNYSSQHEEWKNISPRSVREDVEKYVCNKPHQLIPDPPLSSNWKPVARGPDLTTIYVDTRRITHLSKDIVKAWTLWVLRGKMRRGDVNTLKKYLLFKGKDPNDAKRLWYYIELGKFNCKSNQYATLEDIVYSFGREVLGEKSFQHEKWDDNIPGSIGEDIERYVCKEHKEKK